MEGLAKATQVGNQGQGPTQVARLMSAQARQHYALNSVPTVWVRCGVLCFPGYVETVKAPFLGFSIQMTAIPSRWSHAGPQESCHDPSVFSASIDYVGKSQIFYGAKDPHFDRMLLSWLMPSFYKKGGHVRGLWKL